MRGAAQSPGDAPASAEASRWGSGARVAFQLPVEQEEIGHAAKGLPRSLGKGPRTLFAPSTCCCRFPTLVTSIRQVSALQPSGFVVGKGVQTFLTPPFPKETPRDPSRCAALPLPAREGNESNPSRYLDTEHSLQEDAAGCKLGSGEFQHYRTRALLRGNIRLITPALLVQP